MFLALFITCSMALAVSTLLLISIGHRVRRSSTILAIVLAAVIVVGAGEIAARIWSLPSTYVLRGQAVLLAVGLIAILSLRAWNVIAKVFYGNFLASSLTYLAFAGWYTVAGHLSPLAMAASAMLFALECFALLLAAWYAFDSCDGTCRVRWRRPEPAFDAAHQPMVSLQIAAYNEPADMLIKTIQSAEAIDYPDFEIVVIDNNTKDREVWEPVREYCASRPRVRFEHVDEWPGFKAGALNLAMTMYTDPKAEIVGVIDADYLVDPGYLKSVVGYFSDPKIAFVQTPQDYREWEGDKYLTACADAYEYFFRTTMPSRNDRNSIIFAGTMGLIRRMAIEDLGGWEEWCITEDSEASLRILRAGHSGLYVGKSYGKGIMPLTFSALKSQRFRWCFGGLQILRKHWRELMPWNRSKENHLTTAQRLDYLFGSLHWMNDLIYSAFTVVLLSTAGLLLTTHRLAIRPLLGAVTLLPAALIGSGLLRALWALRTKVGIGPARALRAFANWLSLSWTVALACAQALFRSEAAFLRTPKSEDAPGLIDVVRSAKVETLLAIALWSTGAAIAVKGHATILLIVLFAWQGAVYASAPYMAWLNQRSQLSGELERRRRSESLRERRGRRWPYYAAAAASLGAAAIAVALFTAGGSNPGHPINPFTVPHRSEADRGPLGNIVRGTSPLAPSLAPVPAETTAEPSAEPSAQPTEPAPDASPTATATSTEPASTPTASP